MGTSLQRKIIRFLFFTACIVVGFVVFSPFLTTLAVAGIFAFVIHPYIGKLQNVKIADSYIRCRKKCSALIVLFLMLILAIPFGVVGSKIYYQVKEYSKAELTKQQFVNQFSESIAKMKRQTSDYTTQLGLKEQITFNDISAGVAQKIAAIIFDSTKYIFTQIPNLILNFVIFTIALFCFLAESDTIERFFYQLGLFSRQEIYIVRESLKASSLSTVVANAIAGLAHGVVMALGAKALNVGDFWVVCIVTFFFSFLPVIGATLMALGLCVLALIAENYSAIPVLILIGLFASLVDNVVRPLLLRQKSDVIHPFISLLSILGGIAIFGFSGLFIGPVLVQVIFVAFPKLIHFSKIERNMEGLRWGIISRKIDNFLH